MVNPFHALAGFWFAGGAIAIAIAWTVYTAAPRRKVNRVLSVVLFLEGMGMVVGGLELLLLQRPVENLATLRALHTTFVVYLPILPLYLIFLAAALDVPLVRPLRPAWVQVGILFAVVPVAGFLLAHPEGLMLPDGRPGPYWDWLWVASAAVSAFGLIAAVVAWHTAPLGTERRRRAGLFAVAFGVRDAAWLGFTAYNALFDVRSATDLLAVQIPFAVWGLFTTAYFAILAYGILRVQLFSIDLKIKFAISKSTVVAIFAGGVFVASEAVEQLLGVDQLVPAILAAGVIALAMRPLARVGARLADRVMPGVEDTKEYRMVRKREVYGAAVDSAAADGGITDKERHMLATLQERLGLTRREALDLEREAYAARGVV